MKISCFTNHGPLNSKPVFDALLTSMQQEGDSVLVNRDDGSCDIAVIWSVLWLGRMAKYKNIWETYRRQNKPVVVVEVGGTIVSGIHQGETYNKKWATPFGVRKYNKDAFIIISNNSRRDLTGSLPMDREHMPHRLKEVKKDAT